MKKILSLLVLLVFFTACKDNGEFKIDKIKVSKEYNIFDSMENNLDTVNAGTSLYNKDMKYSFLLDITQESDYEKYLPRYSLEAYVLTDDNFTQYKSYELASEFLRNGNTLQDAYKVISYYYVNRDNLNIFDFNQYILPYSTVYESEITDEVYNNYVLQTEVTRRINLALLKARNMVKYVLENNMQEKKDEDKAMASVMIALSYLAQDRLYQLDNIKKYAALWKEYGGKDVTFLGMNNTNVAELLNYLAYNDNIGLEEVIRDGLSKGFFNIAISQGGVYNYLNDNFYMPVGLAVRNNKYAINPFYERFGDYKITTSILKEIITGKSSSEQDSAVYYKIANNFDKLYDNPIYFLPLKGVVYTIEMKNGYPYRMGFRNPAYYNLNYLNPLDNKLYDEGVFPKILSEYNIPFTQTDYMVYENNKVKTVWKGNIRDQQPDIHRLFKFKGVIDCLEKSVGDTVYICGSREMLILAKYIHSKKCFGKVDCTISADDIVIENH